MSDDSPSNSYNNTHRAFLQALMSRQSITYEEAKPLIAAIHTAVNPERPTLANDVTHEEFEDLINIVSDAITPFDFEIRSSKHQESAERIYALVNTTSDALTQMATLHSADELAFIKRVLDAMFDTWNTQRAEVMAVPEMDAVRLNRAPLSQEATTTTATQQANAGITMAQAERVLGNLVEAGWFEHSEAGFYSLSQRGLMELRDWLEQTYNEDEEDDDDDDDDDEEQERHRKIKSCSACRDIVTMGQRCPNLPCNARLHNHCVRNMFRAQRDSEKCPACNTDWKDAPPVGEDAAAERVAGRRRVGRRSVASTSAHRRTSLVTDNTAIGHLKAGSEELGS